MDSRIVQAIVGQSIGHQHCGGGQVLPLAVGAPARHYEPTHGFFVDSTPTVAVGSPKAYYDYYYDDDHDHDDDGE